jgi:hypothetical protein
MTRLEKYAKRYGDIPYPENITEKQAKRYVETYVKLGRSRGRAKGEVLKKYKKTISRLRRSGYVVPENIKLPAKYDTSYIYAQSFKPNPQTGEVYPGLYARGKSFGVKTKPSPPTPPNIYELIYFNTISYIRDFETTSNRKAEGAPTLLDFFEGIAEVYGNEIAGRLIDEAEKAGETITVDELYNETDAQSYVRSVERFVRKVLELLPQTD